MRNEHCTHCGARVRVYGDPLCGGCQRLQDVREEVQTGQRSDYLNQTQAEGVARQVAVMEKGDSVRGVEDTLLLAEALRGMTAEQYHLWRAARARDRMGRLARQKRNEGAAEGE